MACPVCVDHKLSQPFDQKNGYWHSMITPTLGSIREAAATCGLCYAVFAVFDRMKSGKVFHPDEMNIHISSKPGVPMHITWPGYQQTEKLGVTRVEVDVFTPASELPPTTTYCNKYTNFEVHMAIPDPSVEPWPIIPRWVPISAHSRSEEALRAAKRFMEKCKREHGDQCNPDAGNRLLPTRLLDVRGFKKGRCHIWNSQLEGSDLTANPPYVALSYCWGGEQPHKTTLSNLESRTTDGLDISTLPLTIRDAVKFTSQLGIPYIWVDSLCIVQDDHQDWAREAGRMSSIYESATLTIAADNSPTASSGLFLRHSLGEAVQLKIPGPGGKMVSICARPSQDACKMMVSLDDSDTKNPNVKFKPLATRGWTLQERMLSSRILHFTDRELEWECRSALLCECQGPQPKERRSLVSMNVLYDLSAGRRTFQDAWATIVENFTRRNLTVESDKIPALTGLINRMSAMNWMSFPRHEPGKRRCLSGLWECDTAAQLCWYTAWDWPGRPRARHSPTTPFPSWSWASLDGAVQLRKSVQSRICLVSYRSRDNNDSNEAIAVHAQELTIQGLVAPIQIRYVPPIRPPPDAVAMQSSAANNHSDHYIRPLGLAKRGEQETRWITAIPIASRTAKDKELLAYIRQGEKNFNFDYTSRRVQPSNWEDNGCVAVLVGEDIGVEHDLDGKYHSDVRFSHWMILAPARRRDENEDTGDPVYERVGMTTKSSLYECRLRPEAVDKEITIV